MRFRPSPSSTFASQPSSSRARDELGWEAEVELDEGLKRTLDSLR